MAGQTIVVGWDRANYVSDNTAIGQTGDPGYDSYTYTSADNPVTVIAPTTPGTSAIRYMIGGMVVTTMPLEVSSP